MEYEDARKPDRDPSLKDMVDIALKVLPVSDFILRKKNIFSVQHFLRKSAATLQ